MNYLPLLRETRGERGRSHVRLHDYQPHLQARKEKEKTKKIHFPSNCHSRKQQRRRVVATPTSHMTDHWVCQCVRREKMTTGRLARKLA
ncbi:hypothetical protein GBAR_LOCUS27640, partial [Geodia barretti]